MKRYIPTPDEIPSGLCECGCGKETSIAKRTVSRRREFAGYHVARKPGHCINPSPPPTNANIKGADRYNWKGGRIMNSGYILILTPGHPYGLKHKGYVPEQRLIMEQALGRYLEPSERIHHKNGNRADNRLENLEFFNNQSEHMKQHEFGKHKPPLTLESRQKLSESLRQTWAKRHSKTP